MATIVLSNKERKWLRREQDTWRLIRICFTACLDGKTVTPQRLHALCMLTWITTGADNTKTVTLPALRTLTGKTIAEGDFGNLSDELAKAGVATSIINATKHPTGFVNFYNAFRYSSVDWFVSRTKTVYGLFERAYALKTDEEAKTIYSEIAKLDGVGRGGAGGKLSPKNLLTPVIACLDPRKRCPIINGRKAVREKLRAIGVEKQCVPEQFVALVNLINQGGIADAFMLDVVSVASLQGFADSARRANVRKDPFKERALSQKDENEVQVLRKASQSSYIRIHNKITNRLRSLCKSIGKDISDGSNHECRFDALIKNYDGEYRDLLIEAKSSTDVAFCRMAVGQLLDYRRQLPGSAITDLAVLFGEVPGKHVLDFLGHVGVKALWLRGDEIVDASGSTFFA